MCHPYEHVHTHVHTHTYMYTRTHTPLTSEGSASMTSCSLKCINNKLLCINECITDNLLSNLCFKHQLHLAIKKRGGGETRKGKHKEMARQPRHVSTLRALCSHGTGGVGNQLLPAHRFCVCVRVFEHGFVVMCACVDVYLMWLCV